MFWRAAARISKVLLAWSFSKGEIEGVEVGECEGLQVESEISAVRSRPTGQNEYAFGDWE